MKSTMLSLLALAGMIVVPRAAFAQELSVDEIRANLRAQIRTSEHPQNPTPSATRGLKINNGNGDYVGDLYKARDRPAPPPPPPLAFEVEFEMNSSKITAASFRQIYKVAQAMRDPELAGKAWLIVGHTDSLGSSQRNMTLSEQRANAVAQLLAQLVVEGQAKFFPTGRGEEEPLDGIPSTDHRNRRVEIMPADAE